MVSIISMNVRDLSETSRGEGGVNSGRVTTFWDVKRGRVTQIYAHDHVEVHPQKEKEVLYLVKKKNEQRNIMDANCEVL